MTKFNKDNKDVLTYEECLGPAMKITNKKDAEQYLADYIKFIEKIQELEPDVEQDSAESIAKSNLGYYAGYYSNEVRERVEKLFCCAHPVFGSIKENGIPTPQEAFDMGKNMNNHVK